MNMTWLLQLLQLFSCLKNCYLFPIFCLCTWFFLTFVSHAFCLYIMSSQIFPNHVAKISEFEFLPYSPVSLQVPSRLHSTVLINMISIVSGRSLMKKLKDLGYRPAELYARYYFIWRGNHYFFSQLKPTWYQFHHISLSPSIFFCCLTKSLCLNACLPVCQTQFLLLLHVVARLIQSAQSITSFFMRHGKIHPHIKEHK